jgi:hypothetical protein
MGRKKYCHNPILEELDRLSISELSSFLKVATDQSSLFFNTSDALPGFEKLTVQDSDNPDIFFIAGQYKNYLLRSQVEIVYCAYSHSRYFFICPQTGLRVSHMYVSPSGSYMSRYALMASYRVQREHRGPYYLLSRARDLRKRAEIIRNEGNGKGSEKLYEKASCLQQQFYNEKIGYFQRRINKMREK